MRRARKLGFRCDCGARTSVIDSRAAHYKRIGIGTIRRRRKCAKCRRRFTTIEVSLLRMGAMEKELITLRAVKYAIKGIL